MAASHFFHRARLRIGWGAIGLVAAIMVGCRQTGSVPRPEISTPKAWTAPAVDASPALSGWIERFEDPRLVELVERALAGSPTLEAASARLRAAAQTARINGAVLWPEVNASLTGSRRRTKSRVGEGDGSRLTENYNDTYQAGITVSWELDYLGRLSDRSKAAAATYGNAKMAFVASRLSLVANVARAWFNLLEADSQRALALETVRSFENNLDVIEEQYEAGLSSALDVRLLRANVASARATLAGRERTRDAAARVLEVLVGDYPANALAVDAGLPEAGPPPPAGLPSTLLLRRPDVLAAEYGLEAASLQATAARKALFPSIRLTSATLGRSSDELDALLDGSSTFWNLAGGLTAPLFHGGALRAASRREQALAEAAVADYRQTVLTAFLEVETTLAAESTLRAQEESLALAADESAEAEALAWERYQRGLVEIVTVLEAQRRAFSTRQSLLTARAQRLRNRVDLFLALGGGFRDPLAEVTLSQP